MKIRVLHIIDHLGYGGAPFVVKNLVERMPADQVQSYVCALRPNPRPLPIDATTVTLKSGKYSLAAMRSVPKLCEEHRIDIVHAHLQKAVIVALLARPRFTASLVLHEHGPVFRGGSGCVYRWTLRRFGSRADAIIANSQAAAVAIRQAMSDSRLPVVIVANFIDLERFDPDRCDRRTVRESLGLTEERFVVGFVGRLDRAKGVDLLVDAAARLPRDERSWCIYLLGDGPEKAALAKRIRRLGLERIVVLAGLHENTARVMRAFDLAVVPSRREAFGIAALELMRMRVPVIVSPVGGLPELVRDGETGIVLSRLDVETIAQEIRKLASDETLRDRLARRASEYAGRFDGISAVRQVVEVYQRLIRGA
ncbi:MAG TPA: glycosyltransferase family 4 protein [Sedimentisphaerales bacterium]|nr:glycosyltransferase family 4 protein [Sedimentisphaerales bacterium]HRS12091.1 glycosyltransferase family 4 protein [Sedimentisphaerales bacterium]HRV48689.1 glycosyltransferase family 4 protein [Sedimentisphaerales bacterium]